MRFRQELLYEVVQEIEPLLELHSQELGARPPNPLWQQYAAQERSGSLVIYTARQEGELVGYGIFQVGAHWQHASLMVATNTALFLRAENRSGGSGARLIRFCEKALTEKLKDFTLVWSAKPGTDFDKVLARMEYPVEEVVRSKNFKGK